MKLSVIVVNHNMCNKLRQALFTLNRACRDIDYELIVVDDASADKSVAMLGNEFPHAKLIVNQHHAGVAKARNQGIEEAKGEYVLLVNADTISGKKTVEHVLKFMDAHNDAGGVGVRMLSPRGKFISESRTGFSRAWGGLLKLTGLAKHFPKSRLYKNDDDWVEDEEFATTEVDVINGAFMLLRRSVVNHVGDFDERFVKFGHDIDLSFRIRLAGYKNYYFPKTYILSFNTRLRSKFTWSYIRHFYGAMIIFAAKYLLHMPEIKIPAIPQMFAPKYEIER
ncbi:glycosyltransferase family 2 protein [Mucilaginibacter sp. AK015]|uniref:glycosyltransferase family 2 protein n=1 Tax=Mucilaginibacter sp. AK015 TaxID=2723072 RepID=UPI00160C08C9|nr:glycosyltransferase family 2 protein [Mucilaginibacter sp. AK015]MBB5394299.1 GT2 family glycosyltransferase [Mucilaginibacter sp. AK015]